MTLSTLNLIGCTLKKRAETCRAADLYLGRLYALSRIYAERKGLPWRILSPEHGLLHPDAIVAPYSKRMSRNQEERRQWAIWVASAIKSEFPSKQTRILLIASPIYTSELGQRLIALGYCVSEPMENMGLDQRTKWIRARIPSFARTDADLSKAQEITNV